MCFYYLLAGHLLGDFTLQTDTIAYKKMKKLEWLFIHVLIVILSMLIFSLPFGHKIIFLVFINGIIHFFIDYFKLKLRPQSPTMAFVYFALDQFCHILIIYFISLFYTDYYKPVLGSNYIFFITSLLFILSFSSVCIQFLLKILCHLDYKGFFIKNEKKIGNVNRIVIFITILISHNYSFKYLVILPIALAGLIIYYKVKLEEWMPVKYFIIKLLLEILFALSGFWIYEFLKS